MTKLYARTFAVVAEDVERDKARGGNPPASDARLYALAG